MIYYIKSYFNSYQEYKADKAKIVYEEPVETFIKKPEQADQFINLAARLKIEVKDTSLGQWADFLQSQLDYLLTKATQKTLFQSSFFRRLPPEMRVSVVEYIPNPPRPAGLPPSPSASVL